MSMPARIMISKTVLGCGNRLRKVMFPNGRRWENEDSGLYARIIREILREAGKAVADRYRYGMLDSPGGAG